MRIALIDTAKKPTHYPVALLKIGAWRRSLRDDCQLFTNRLPKDADEIWLTTCFTFDIPHALGIVREAKNRASVVKVGGVAATLLPEYFEKEGVEVHRGLIPEVEEFSPDYSLLPELPKYSIVQTSRGCIRKCKFCMVHRLEPEFYNREWIDDVALEAKRILFYDNNWLVKNIEDLTHDVDLIRGLVEAGRVTSVDFNEGLDCRLLTDEKADLLKGVPIRPVRFSFDGMHEDGHYQRAVRMMAARGFREFMTYVLYNFMDTPKDFYYRLRESVCLAEELSSPINSFPMRYQPILDVDDGREYVGKHWTRSRKKGFMNILNRQSVDGQISMTSGAVSVSSFPMRYEPILEVDKERTHVGEHWTSGQRQAVRVLTALSGAGDQVSMTGGKGMRPIEEFEYWFGKDADEFDRLLSYPKIRELAKRKKGALRMARAAVTIEGET